jgi:hypothetical protein
LRLLIYRAPVVVDSGNGLHVYWILKEAVETSVWKPYAEKFKKLCHQHKLVIDPAVPADAARVLRVPFTKNYCKDGTVKDVVLINDELYTYDFDEIVGCFGEVTISESKKDALDLKNTRKKLTDKDKQLLGLDRYEHSFEVIANSSIERNRVRPNQKLLLKNRTSSDYRALWRAGRICRLLGVLMALNLPYTNYQSAYPDYVSTTNKKQKQKLQTLACGLDLWMRGV